MTDQGWTTEVDICPACYRQRDQIVPVLKVEWYAQQDGWVPRDGETGERLRPARGAGKVTTCLVCSWSKVETEEPD